MSPTASDRVLAAAQAAHLAGEIAIADQDGASVDRSLGLADRGSRRPHQTGQQWLWASVTKQVTAVLVLQQVEAGKLSLDGAIKTYLPDYKGSTGERVTVRQLLQHLSGLPNPDDAPPDVNGVPGFYTQLGVEITDQARASGYCSGKPKAEPGAAFAYNNCDYLVLGAILERVAAEPYARLVIDRIAKPLGLKSLSMAPDGLSGTGGVVGYTAGGARHPPVNVATFGAAGALTGTALDLAMLDRALAEGILLQPETRSAMWRGDPKLGYEALGVWSFSARLKGCETPVALIERRGDVGGVQVRNVIAPSLGRSLAVFTNDDAVDFGKVWEGKGLSYDLLSAALCPPPQS